MFKQIAELHERVHVLCVPISDYFAAYTVGHTRAGYPELVVLGHDASDLTRRIDALSIKLRSSPVPSVEGYILRTVPHDDIKALAPIPFEVFGEGRVKFLHGIYADAAGLFPGHPHVDQAIDRVQMSFWEQSPKPTSKTKETMEEQVRVVRQHVWDGGVAIMPGLSGSYGYTVGHAKKGRPELLMCEIEPGDCDKLLPNLSEAYMEGHLNERSAFRIRMIGSKKARSLAPFAFILSPDAPVEVSQLIFPDMNGKFPWQKGVSPSLALLQAKYWE